jgi:hypothetical protein
MLFSIRWSAIELVLPRLVQLVVLYCDKFFIQRCQEGSEKCPFVTVSLEGCRKEQNLETVRALLYNEALYSRDVGTEE